MVKSITFSGLIGFLIALATEGVSMNGSGSDLADDKMEEGCNGP